MKSHEDNTGPGREIHRLAVARVVCSAVAFGMTLAGAIVLVITLIQAARGNLHALTSLRGLLMMAAMVAGAALAVPRIDRRILDLARKSSDCTCALGLLRLATGMPLFSNRAPVEEELARQLGEVDTAWWEENRKDLRAMVAPALCTSLQPDLFHRADGPWLPALVRAVGRCERTEHLKTIEAILKPRSKAPAPVKDEAQMALESLLRRQRRDREAATLLRAAAPTDETLLRPAVSAATDPELLLRAGEP